MEDVKVCRICLVVDVKLYDLRSYPLVLYYESVIETPPLYSNLPHYACYVCAALIKKFYLFRQQSLNSQAVLCGITENYGKITQADINAIDRQSFNFISKLGIVSPTTECISSSPIEHEIKHEQDNDDELHTFVNEDDLKEESNGYDAYQPLDNSVSSDDDEPLSLHKKKKTQKEDNINVDEEILDSKKELPELKKTLKSLLQFEDSADDGILEPKSKNPKQSKNDAKRKRGRPKKISVKKELKNPSLRNEGICDISQYITVITLSVEEQLEEIKKRKESSNYQNSPYQCELCYKGFIDTDAWKHHVSKHSPSAGSVECQICKFRFKTKRALQKHASGHEKKYACKSCPYISTNTTQAKQHQGWHKGVTFKCKHCDEIFTVWTSYMSHVRIKHPSEFICGICGYSFISKLGLTMHKTMMHKDVQVKVEETKEDGPYCAECDVKFISTEAYKRHMVMSVKHTRTTDSIKGCRTCGATFENAEELRVHHRKEHTRKRPKNYGKKPADTSWPAKCIHCSEEIPNAREYWTHFRRVHPDKDYPIAKNYVCDICGKSFRGNAFLVYHKRTHFEERPYKCSQCNKAFFNRTNLQVHEKTHSDVRPYPCSVCFKAFKCKGALNRHFRVHEELYLDIRPFPCSACTKAFKFKGALDRHFVSHTGQKPYECEVCGKGFSQSNSRKLHVRTVHLRQPAPYLSRARQERRKDQHKEHHVIY